MSGSPDAYVIIGLAFIRPPGRRNSRSESALHTVRGLRSGSTQGQTQALALDVQVVRIAALCAHRYQVEFVRTKGQSLGNLEAEILSGSLVPYAVPLSFINFEVR